MGDGFGHEKAGEGQTNDWLTPPLLVSRLSEFDLDPCGCPGQPWMLAKRTFFLPDENGLLLPWHGRVFCNPPYGPHVGQWVRRMSLHGNGILLIFSRTETDAWRAVWETGDGFLFPHGRISFLKPDGKRGNSGGTAPSALVAYGENNMIALRNCGLAGALFGRAEILQGIRSSNL